MAEPLVDSRDTRLSDEQRAQRLLSEYVTAGVWASDGYSYPALEVRGSDERVYHVIQGGPVLEQNQPRGWHTSWCLMIDEGHMPTSDVMLAKMLLLKADANLFRSTAISSNRL